MKWSFEKSGGGRSNRRDSPRDDGEPDPDVGRGVRVVAWSAYALVEYVICAIWPLFTTDQAVFTPLNGTLTAWLFNAYWVIGGAALTRQRRGW
jgi:hypothetical protein